MNDNTLKKKATLSFQVPYSFIIEKVSTLTWGELRHGILSGYVTKHTAIEHAIATVNSSTDSKSPHFKLASLYNSEQDLVESLLSEIIKGEPFQDKNEIKDKWTYLLIFWVYSNPETPFFINDTPPIILNGTFEILLALFEELEYPVELAEILGYSDESDYSISYLEEIKKYLIISEKKFNK